MSTLSNRLLNSGRPLPYFCKHTNIVPDRMEELFNGAEATMPELRLLSELLKVSIGDLLSENPEYDNAFLLFRKIVKKQDYFPSIDRYSSVISNTLPLLQSRKSHFDWLTKFPVVQSTLEGAETLAYRFRELFAEGDNVGPLIDLPEIVSKKMGCVLIVVNDQGAEGASAIIKGIPYIFVSPRFSGRMLFTVAHELCHLIVHHSQGEEEFVYFDEEIEIKSPKSSIREMEAFANAFASALLLPINGVGITLKKLREVFYNKGDVGDIELLYLSRIFGVSFEVAARRCETLHLIPRGGAGSLYEKLKKEHGGPEERARELGLPEREVVAFPSVSEILLQSALEKISSGDLSIGRAAGILGLSVGSLVESNKP